MVLEHALRSVAPGREEDFEESFGQATAIVAGMPGFGRLTLSRCLERTSTYLLLVEWDELEDHTVGFRGSPGYQRRRRLLHHALRPVPRRGARRAGPHRLRAEQRRRRRRLRSCVADPRGR